MVSDPLFDKYAENYHSTANQALKVSGEDSTYFAINRIEWTKQKLVKLFHDSAYNHILDFGCGTGDSTPILKRTFSPDIVTGIDASYKSIEIAKRNHDSAIADFYTVENIPETIKYDLAYCNGVFHHIPPAKRDRSVRTVLNLLNQNGILALWENNPWNPGTRYIMNKCPFDQDAVTLSYLEGKKLLSANGFKVINISFSFIFPKNLKFLRVMEKSLSIFPIGAQYLILAQKI